MKKQHIRTVIIALALITSANVLLRFLRKIWCDECIEILIVSKIILAVISIGFVLKYGFRKKLRDGMRVFSIWTLVAFALVVMAFIQMERIILPTNISTTENIKFLIFNLSTGFFEEVFFRIFVFYFILQSMRNIDHALWKTTLWTSICFGFAHVTNLLSGLDFLSLVLLILFATVVGIILQGIYIRTKSLVLVIVLHGLINYFGTYKSVLIKSMEYVETSEWNRLFGTLIFIGLLFLIFVLPIRRYLISSKV